MKRRKNAISTKKWLLLAGLAAGAYWLYTKNKTAGPAAADSGPRSTNITASVPGTVAV